jgi:hypothetical protein
MKHTPWRPARSPISVATTDPTNRPLPFGDEEERKKRQPTSAYDLTLALAAQAWMKSLPEALRPIATSQQYPRIVNRIARFWDSPRMLDEVFDELLVDKRVGRKGFSREVQLELRKLHADHRSRNPRDDKLDMWSSVPERDRKPPRR